MAVAVRSERRQITPRPAWVRRRSNDGEGALPLILVVVLAIGVTALILSGQMLQVSVPRGWIATFQPAAPSRPTDGAVPVTTMTAATSAPDASAENVQAASEAPAFTVGQRARVAHTDNLGVVFYAAPRDNARLPAGLLEGTAVTVLELSGPEWARVQADSKKIGWVHAEYLAPVD